MSLSFRQRVALVLIPHVAAIVIRLLGATLRYQDYMDPGAVRGDTLPGPTVFAFWHRSLLVCAHRFRRLDIAILISQSFDGELIARTVELLGFTAVRGSSTRSGLSGLRGMEQAYRRGRICAITADGPKGPSMIAKPGAAQLGRLVQAPVGAFYVLPLQAWELRSWDRFLIPKPFSRVIVTWPARVPVDEVSEAAVQTALDRAVGMAEAVHSD